jgi:hypothetical protein
MCIKISMSEKTQREKDIEYHEVFMRQLRFYFNQGFDLERSIFRAHEETWLELAEQDYHEKLGQMEEAHNQPPPDKCLFTESDEENNSPKKNDRLRSARTLKALKEIIEELNKSVEALQQENKELKHENSQLTEKVNNIKSVISG